MRIANVVGVVVLSALVVRAVQAQSKPERCDELKAEAEEYETSKKYTLLNETLRLRASECPTAVAFFEAGVALLRVNASVDSRDVEGAAGKSGERLLQAMNYLEEALRRKDPPLSEINAATAGFHINQLQAKLVLIQLVPADIREQVSVELDGRELKLTSDRFWTTPGAHALVFTPKAQGYAPFVPELPVLSGGQTHVVQVAMPPSTAEQGRLRVATRPTNASVLVDGVPAKRDEAGIIWLLPGEHQVETSADSYRPQTEMVVIEAGSSRVLQVSLQHQGAVRRRPIGAILVGGTGAALLATGAITGGVALAKNAELADKCDANKVCPPSQHDTKQKAEHLATATDVLLVTGGVALVAGVAWYFLFPGKSEQPPARASLEPMISGSRVGLRLRAAF